LSRYNLSPLSPDLGPGAGVHFSSVSEPVGAWLKFAGVRESPPLADGTAFPVEVLAAARERKVTGR
jgi:hypothetical protein